MTQPEWTWTPGDDRILPPMPDAIYPADAESLEVGWRVLDPDGNVVASGPGMVLAAAGDILPPDDDEDEDE